MVSLSDNNQADFLKRSAFLQDIFKTFYSIIMPFDAFEIYSSPKV